MTSDATTWYPEVLPPDGLKTLTELSANSALLPFYLAGGTALALQWGHRKSVDLDFFSFDHVDENNLLKAITLADVTVISKERETAHLHINATKVSFLGYHYPVLFPFGIYSGIKIADPRDIGAMKVDAVASRGAKRDFVDLYFLAQRYGLDDLIRYFQQKFAHVDYNVVHLLKSMTYFALADKEPMPHMIQPVSWEMVKHFFMQQAPRLRKRT